MRLLDLFGVLSESQYETWNDKHIVWEIPHLGVRIAVDTPGDANYVSVWDENNERIGQITTRSLKRRHTNQGVENYLNIGAVSLDKKWRGKGIGIQMYRALLRNLSPKYAGISSYLPDVKNKRQVPKIYRRLGATHEGDDFKYVPRIDEAKPFDSFGAKKAGHLYDFPDNDIKGIGFWLNPATKEYATVPWDAVNDETHHVDVLLNHPERFGISKKLLKQYIKDVGFGTDDAIGIGLASGWVRISLVEGIRNEANIDARNPLEARAALRWVLTHYPNTNVANITIWPFKFTDPQSSVDVNSVIDPKSFQIGQSQFHAYVERGIIGRSRIGEATQEYVKKVVDPALMTGQEYHDSFPYGRKTVVRLLDLIMNESTDRIIHDASPQQLKGLANRAQDNTIRFVVYDDGSISAGDAYKYMHAEIAPSIEAWAARGFIRKMPGGEYLYTAQDNFSNDTIDLPAFRALERGGIQNGSIWN